MYLLQLENKWEESPQPNEVKMLPRVHVLGNAIRNAQPPAFIFSRVMFNKERMMRQAPAGSQGFSNPSGWMNNAMLLKVLQHVLRSMNISNANPDLLIFDDHRSYLSLEIITLAKENGLHIFTFRPTAAIGCNP